MYSYQMSVPSQSSTLLVEFSYFPYLFVGNVEEYEDGSLLRYH